MATQNLLTPESVQLTGGLDYISPRPSVAPGSLIDCVNFEVSDRIGYKRIDGIEIFDGSCSSSLTYSSLYSFKIDNSSTALSVVQAGNLVYKQYDSPENYFAVVTSVEPIDSTYCTVNVVVTDLVTFRNILNNGTNFPIYIDVFLYNVQQVEEYSFAHSSSGFALVSTVTTVADSVAKAVAENANIEASKQKCVTRNYVNLGATNTNKAIGMHWYNERLYTVIDLDSLAFSDGNFKILPNDLITFSGASVTVRDVQLLSGSWDNGDAAGIILFTFGPDAPYNSKNRALTPTAGTSIDLTRGTVLVSSVALIASRSNAAEDYKPWMAGLSYALNQKDLGASTSSPLNFIQGYADVELGYVISYKDGTSNGPPSPAIRNVAPAVGSKSYTGALYPGNVSTTSPYVITDDSISSFPGQTALLYHGNGAVQCISASGDGKYIYPISPGKSTPTQLPCIVQVSTIPMTFSGFDFSSLTEGTLVSDIQVSLSFFGNAKAVSEAKYAFKVDITVDGVNYSAIKKTANITSSSSAAPNSATLGGASDVWTVPGLNLRNISGLQVRVSSNYLSSSSPPNASLLYLDSLSVSVGYQKNYGTYYFNNGTDDVTGVISNVYLDTSNGGDWSTNNASGTIQVTNVTPYYLPTPTGIAVSTSTTGGTGLSAATTYYYVISAIGATGETLPSTEVSILTGAGTTNSNALSWSGVTGAASYRVYRGTSAGNENVYYSTTSTSYTDTGAAPAGSSIPSNFSTATNSARTQINAGDKIYSLPNAGGILIATVSSDMTYAGLPSKASIDAVSSRYEIIDANFYGAAEWSAMYGCSGAGRAWAFDGTYFRYIYTGIASSVDTPRHVAFHNFHLLLGYSTGAILSSVAGSPENFSGVDGAGEFDTGDPVVGILRLSGTSLGLFCKKSIHALNGTDNTNFSLSMLSPYDGAIEYTVLDCGRPVWTSCKGICTLNQSGTVSNFSDSRLSYAVMPWLLPRVTNTPTYVPQSGSVTTADNAPPGGVLFAIPSRYKNQYRLAFSDGYWLTLTFNTLTNNPEFTIQRYYTKRGIVFQKNWTPLAATSFIDATGKDRAVMSIDYYRNIVPGETSSANQDYMYVWELDRGWGFNSNTPVQAWITTTHNFFDNPFQIMTVRNIRLHGQSLGLASVNMAISSDYSSDDFSYGDIHGESRTNSPLQDISLPRDGGKNPFGERAGSYVAETNIASAGKTGRSFSIQLSTDPSSIEPPCVLQQLMFQLSSGKADIK